MSVELHIGQFLERGDNLILHLGHELNAVDAIFSGFPSFISNFPPHFGHLLNRGGISDSQ